MIEINNVAKKYKNNESIFYAIKNFNLKIKNNEFVAIIGKSGSGKSTILNMIGTLEKIDEGEIFIDGKNIKMLNESELALFRNKKIGFVFQNFFLEPEYTVYENIKIPLIISKSYQNREIDEKIKTMLNKVGLFEKRKNKAKTLSGGEAQRVAIARALINDPDYIFADEPCGNLDSKNSQMIMSLLKNIHKENKTIILVTHDHNDARNAERIITISDGEIINEENLLFDN